MQWLDFSHYDTRLSLLASDKDYFVASPIDGDFTDKMINGFTKLGFRPVIDKPHWVAPVSPQLFKRLANCKQIETVNVPRKDIIFKDQTEPRRILVTYFDDDLNQTCVSHAINEETLSTESIPCESLQWFLSSDLAYLDADLDEYCLRDSLLLPDFTVSASLTISNKQESDCPSPRSF